MTLDTLQLTKQAIESVRKADVDGTGELFEIASNQLSHIQGAAASLPCDDPQAAILLLRLIASNNECLFSWVYSGSSRYELCEDIHLRTNAMAMTLIKYIEATSGEKSDPFLVQYYGPDCELASKTGHPLGPDG